MTRSYQLKGERLAVGEQPRVRRPQPFGGRGVRPACARTCVRGRRVDMRPEGFSWHPVIPPQAPTFVVPPPTRRPCRSPAAAWKARARIASPGVSARVLGRMHVPGGACGPPPQWNEEPLGRASSVHAAHTLNASSKASMASLSRSRSLLTLAYAIDAGMYHRAGPSRGLAGLSW